MSLCVSADLELPQDSFVEVVVAFVDLTHCWLRLIGPDYSVSGGGGVGGGAVVIMGCSQLRGCKFESLISGCSSHPLPLLHLSPPPSLLVGWW